MAKRFRYPRTSVAGTMSGANGILGAVKKVGGQPRSIHSLPGYKTPNPRPPGNPTGKRTTTG